MLLQLSLVLDCVDGDVARYTRRFSPLGAWLDASTDRLKEFACYAGLAWGADAGRTGWVLAAAMITLQTARHTVDYTFTAVKDLREAEVVRAPLDQQDEPVRRGAGDVRAARAIELSRRSSAARPAVTWLKKVLHLGIGERWLVISVLAAAQLPLGGPGGAAGPRGRVAALHVGRAHPAGPVLAGRAGARPGAGDRAGPGRRRPRWSRPRRRPGSPAGRAGGSGSCGCGRRCCGRGSTSWCSG